MDKMKTAKPNSAVAPQPCPSGHITTDKRLRYASPKPSPLCILLEGEVNDKMNLIRFRKESNHKGLEGWASFIRRLVKTMGLKYGKILRWKYEDMAQDNYWRFEVDGRSSR